MNFMKSLFRFIFKIPPRKQVGFYTLFLDIKAWMKIGWNTIFKNNNREKQIYICIPMLDRLDNLFSYLLPSLEKANATNKICISIADFGSKDFEEKISELKASTTIPIIAKVYEQKFNRSRAVNAAISQVPQAENIFICDADMQLPSDFFQQYFRYVNSTTAWFPICEWEIEKGSNQFRWFTEGVGMAGVSRKHWINAGKLNEEIEDWGKEDWLFYFAIYQTGVAGIRNRCKGLKHYWHPSHKPADYKKMF